MKTIAISTGTHHRLSLLKLNGKHPSMEDVIKSLLRRKR